jgi:hypothetical protein
MPAHSTAEESLEVKFARDMRERVKNGQMRSHVPKAIELACLEILERSSTPLQKKLWMGYLEVARLAGSHDPF